MKALAAACVDPAAPIFGDATLGEGSSLWPCAALEASARDARARNVVEFAGRYG